MNKAFGTFLLIIFATTACTGKRDATSAGASNAKVLRLAFSDDLRSADPAQVSDMLSAELLGHIFEGLLAFSYLGKPGSLEPSLSTAVPRVTDKTRALKFTIRPDARFADDEAFKDGKGRPVVASDFVFSIKRIADPRVGEQNWWMFSGVVEGLDEWREKVNAPSSAEEKQKAFDAPVGGLVAHNDRTFEIKLKKAYPQILYVLAMPQTAAVAREVVEKYGPEIVSHPVGTGPFKLKEWVQGSKILVERNRNFRKVEYPNVGNDEDRQSGRLQASGKALPFLEEIHWDIIKEESPRWLKFLKGQLDETGIPKDSFNDAIGANGKLKSELTSKGIVLHKELSLTTWWLEFNMLDPVVGKNVKLRQALAHAFDRQRALDLLYNGRGTLASGPIAPIYEGGQDGASYPYKFDLEKAKKLLAEAGFPGGEGLPELTFDLRGPGTTPRQLGELLVDNFGRIGVKIKILGNSFQEALDKAKNARFQIMLGGWHADYPDPENYLQLFITSNKAPGSNVSNFSNPEFDKLYEVIRAAPPSKKRTAQIARMVQILNENAAQIFFFHAVDYFVSQGWVKNFKPHQLLYGVGRYVDVDPAQRQALLGKF